jgi:hypothetical protein
MAGGEINKRHAVDIGKIIEQWSVASGRWTDKGESGTRTLWSGTDH